MKRCPTCNRVENDDTLTFCRVDGALLVGSSSELSGEVGTVRLGSPSGPTETETSILPHLTNPASHGTGATTVLQPATPLTTAALAKPKRKAIVIAVVVTAMIAATTAVVVNSYLSKKREQTIDSIAVLPFQNTRGDPNVEYLSDGIAESLINSLTQLTAVEGDRPQHSVSVQKQRR